MFLFTLYVCFCFGFRFCFSHCQHLSRCQHVSARILCPCSLFVQSRHTFLISFSGNAFSLKFGISFNATILFDMIFSHNLSQCQVNQIWKPCCFNFSGIQHWWSANYCSSAQNAYQGKPMYLHVICNADTALFYHVYERQLTVHIAGGVICCNSIIPFIVIACFIYICLSIDSILYQ